MAQPTKLMLFIACCLTQGFSAGAATLSVPSFEYPTIQQAIADAIHSDTIVVAPGTYQETIDLLGKAITLRSMEGPATATISGQGRSGSVITCVSGEGPDTVIDGFKIVGGTGTPIGPNSATFGGGMLCQDSGPTVRNCVFADNTANTGGGMYNSASHPIISGCTFRSNNAVSGGGLQNVNSNPTLTDCVFTTNFAEIKGAAVSNVDSSPTITHCTFLLNQTPIDGGGIINAGDSQPSISNCVFRENSAMDGGAMGNFEGARPLVANCAFHQNQAGRLGGAMYNIGSDPTLIGCVFGGNTAGVRGGGMNNQLSSPLIANCTFSGNATNLFEGGGMFNNAASFPTVINSILWGNSPDTIAGAGTPFVAFSDVEGGGFLGTGNIEADPLFIDPEDGDFRLRLNSPCIDAGDATVPYMELGTDVGGAPRVVGGGVDMGAYENQGMAAPAVAEWGMVVLTLLTLVAGTALFRAQIVTDCQTANRTGRPRWTQ